jgi:O-antigen/teichoic acid export membrane protein
MKWLKTNSERTAMIRKNVAVSFVLKMVAAVITLIMVPLTLTCLGEYKNGVWLTISSMLVWIDQMDIGLGNGLRNRLAICVAHDDMLEARRTVSSTMAMLVCIIVPLTIVLVALVLTTDVHAFFNADPLLVPDLRTALLAAVILVCMTFVLKFIGNVYMGMQLPAVSNLIIVTGQAIALAATWLLLENGAATFINVVIANTAAPLAVYLLSYPLTFGIKYPKLRPALSMVNLRVALSMGNIGLRFFWLQMASVIQFMTASILISKFFTPEMVTPYTIAYRYFSLVLVAFTVICMPFWNATTDAYARGDMAWIRSANRRMTAITMLFGAAMVVMVIVSPFVYHVWIAEKSHVPFAMTVMMAVYVFLLIASTRYSYFLNGIGALRLQLYMTVSVVVFIPLAWYVSQLTHNIISFMIVMCACIAPSVVVNKIQFSKILSGNANGIWKI